MSHLSKPGGSRRPKITMATHTGVSKAGSERDSGFSDQSSGYLSAVDLTDSEETGRTVSALGQDQTAVVGCSYPGINPMIIMNNFVLKQPNSVTPPEKQWTFPSSMEVAPQSQVVLLQPMVSNCGVGPAKTTAENNAQSMTNYLPILQSYPRIAPHPEERPSKRQGSTSLGAGSVPGQDKRQRRQHHSATPYSSPSATPIRRAPVKALPRPDSPALDALDCPPRPSEKLRSLLTDDNGATASSSSADPRDLAPPPPAGDNNNNNNNNNNNLHHDAATPQEALRQDGDKLKRFSNTCNILNKSGLLGITLRTKQLMKENRRTQGQLRLLQEHTDLLMEALRTGDPQVWARLQLAMQDKASPQGEGQQLGGGLQVISV
ncbi:unnamed protein product [Lota lota]